MAYFRALTSSSGGGTSTPEVYTTVGKETFVNPFRASSNAQFYVFTNLKSLGFRSCVVSGGNTYCDFFACGETLNTTGNDQASDRTITLNEDMEMLAYHSRGGNKAFTFTFS